MCEGVREENIIIKCNPMNPPLLVTSTIIIPYAIDIFLSWFNTPCSFVFVHIIDDNEAVF